MHYTVWAPLLLCALLARLAAPAGNRLAPPAAVRLLTGLSVFTAAATVWALALLAVGGLSRVAEVQQRLNADQHAVAVVDSVPATAGILAAATLTIVLTRAALLLAGTWRTRHAISRALAGTPAGELVVLPDTRPDAYAVAVHGGRIVVTTGMLRVLDASDRRVLFAHEHAHLRHRHHRYRLAATLGAALNPLLGPVRDGVDLHTERWADEDTAATTGRRRTADALTRAALAATPSPSPTTLGYVHGHVLARVRALHGPRPRTRWRAAWPPITATVLAATALIDATGACQRLLHLLHP